MKVGIEVTVVAPEVNPAAAIDKELWSCSRSAKVCYKTRLIPGTADGREMRLKKIIAESDVVYTDTWVDMEFFTDPTFAEERERRLEKMMTLSVEFRTVEEGTIARLCTASPAHHGYEISQVNSSTMNVQLSFDQSENRLHSMKAILLKIAFAFLSHKPSERVSPRHRAR